jgi:hypothetical protein
MGVLFLETCDKLKSTVGYNWGWENQVKFIFVNTSCTMQVTKYYIGAYLQLATRTRVQV